MTARRTFIGIAWLLLLAVAGCSGHGATPCTSCDAAAADRAADRSIASPTADAASNTADSRRRQPIDATEVDGDDDVRDALAGEVPSPATVPDGGYLFMDHFGNGKADGWQILHWIDAGVPAPDWTVIDGDVGTVYSQRSLDVADWHISYWTGASIGDQIVEAQIRVVDFYAQAPSYVAAVFGRYDPLAYSGYLLALRGDGSLIIRKRDHGTTASFASGIDVGVKPGVWYTVRLEILGDTISAYLDGGFVSAVTDSDPLAEGGIALGSFGATMEVDSIFLAAP